MSNSNGNRNPYIIIKGFGTYRPNNFTTTDGNPLPKIDIINTTIIPPTLKFEDLKIGDVLVCTYDGLKTITKNCLYQIENLITIKKKRILYNYISKANEEVERSINYIKLQGIKRKILFNPYKFRKLNVEESRDLSLGKLFLEETPVITSTKRKIDLVQNKNKKLIETLSKSILDQNRHHLSIVDWACQKSDTKLGISSEDFTELLELPLKDILAKIEPIK
jgi:hypothetical protein